MRAGTFTKKEERFMGYYVEKKCSRCGGTGKVKYRRVPYEIYSTIAVQCPTDHPFAEGEPHTCYQCSGTGKEVWVEDR
jgi:DnaJ-class molecular chaperone